MAPAGSFSRGPPARFHEPGNRLAWPRRGLPTRQCGRKKGAADGLRVPVVPRLGIRQSSKDRSPATDGRTLGRRMRPARPAFGATAASNRGRCPCRARSVSFEARASLARSAAARGWLLRVLAITAVSQEKLRSRLRAAALSRAEGHATTARRESTPLQQHRVAGRHHALRLHASRLRYPRKRGCARNTALA
jgi:hypothetical protein